MNRLNEVTRFSVGAVLLGAGRSERMGRPKLLLPWGRTTVLGQLLRQWTEIPAQQVAVVCGPVPAEIHGELERLGFPAANRIINPEPERGMFSSIQCASAWTGWKPDLTHFVISLGDQPHLRPETLRALIEFGAAHRDHICQPLRGGRRRHPVLLPKAAFLALAGGRAANLKEFLEERSGSLAGFESADQGLDIDLDTPADYDRARQRCFPAGETGNV